MMKRKKPSRCSSCPLSECKIVQPSASKATEVVFLAAVPPQGTSRAFGDFGGTIIRGLLKKLGEEHSSVKVMEPKTGFAYAVWCRLPEEVNLKKSHIEYCRDNVSLSYLETLKPRVILAFGGQDISTFLGVAGQKKGEMRGTSYKHKWRSGGYSTVVFTISLRWLVAKPGLSSIVCNDIITASKEYVGSTIKRVDFGDLADRYDCPTTLVETREVIDAYSVYSGPDGVEQTLMGMDTETSSLFSWDTRTKVISLSAAFSKDMALSFAVDHREASYSLEDIAPWVIKLTMSPHPKCWWNYKFDLGMFKFSFLRRLKEVMTPGLSKDILRITGCTWGELLSKNLINNTRWDGILAKHLLQEALQGFYGLKFSILEYLPELYGYEETLNLNRTKVEECRLGDIDKDMEELSLLDLKIDTDLMCTTTPLMDVRRVYEEGKRKIARRVRGFINQGRDGRSDLERIKLNSLAIAYADLRAKILKGKKDFQSTLYVKKADIAGQPTLYTYEDLDKDLLLAYGAIDAAATVSICQAQRKELYKQSKSIKDKSKKSIMSLMDSHCLPLSDLFSTIQAEGVYVDQEYSTQLQGRLSTDINQVVKTIKGLLKTDFPGCNTENLNFSSDRDVGNILIGWYGLPVLEVTDKDNLPSMKGVHLKVYNKKHKNKVAGLLVDLTTLRKAKSDFVDKFLYLSSYDEKLHGNYSLFGTTTGRASGNNPNLTNVPERVEALGQEYIVKKCIIPTPIHKKEWWIENAPLASKYGWYEGDKLVVVDADLSGAELRILTRFAPDKGLIGAIINGLDVHSWITSEIHGIPYEEINSTRKESSPRGKYLNGLRDGTKGVVFKIMYGGVPEDKALMYTIFNRFPAIPKYMEDTKREVLREGLLVTPNGRPRRFPLVRFSQQIERRNYRQGINFYVQSYCSDIVMHTLNNIYLKLQGIRGRLLLTVHDSIVFEIPESNIHKLNEFLTKNITEHIQTSFPDIPVPMTYGYKIGRDYGEMYSLKDWREGACLK
jgi:DNA polymerase I-like protein with 3'-5' exonuclease and polymerase domains/uracil-DNA glycosylase